jgi:hypothetical protein
MPTAEAQTHCNDSCSTNEHLFRTRLLPVLTRSSLTVVRSGCHKFLRICSCDLRPHQQEQRCNCSTPLLLHFAAVSMRFLALSRMRQAKERKQPMHVFPRPEGFFSLPLGAQKGRDTRAEEGTGSRTGEERK